MYLRLYVHHSVPHNEFTLVGLTCSSKPSIPQLACMCSLLVARPSPSSPAPEHLPLLLILYLLLVWLLPCAVYVLGVKKVNNRSEESAVVRAKE